MYDKNHLCHRITELFPDVGVCGIDIDVDFDADKNVYIVDLKKESHALKHHLELGDAEPCMDGKQCVALGLEIAQLMNNVQGKQF